MSWSAETFGEMLASARNRARVTQRGLENQSLGLSYSFICKLEKGTRGAERIPLTRKQIWYLIRRLDLWPWRSDKPNCDDLFRAAGMSSDRTAAEEQEIQKSALFDELWVFARVLLDPGDEWYEIVRHNIEKRGITYRYFVESPEFFDNLLARLKADRVPQKILKSQIECTILPRQFFFTNFAIYKRKGDGDSRASDDYYCGTKSVDGEAEWFYTMDISQGKQLLETLLKWRLSINVDSPILLSPAKRIFPDEHRSEFKTA